MKIEIINKKTDEVVLTAQHHKTMESYIKDFKMNKEDFKIKVLRDGKAHFLDLKEY